MQFLSVRFQKFENGALFRTLVVIFTISSISSAFANPKITSLEEARFYIEDVAQNLDPNSEYISEVIAILEKSQDLEDFEKNLKKSRGFRWAGPKAFGKMSLAERIHCNLITNETWASRFQASEIAFLREVVFSGASDERTYRVLVLPSSHGSESLTFGLMLEEMGKLDFHIHGVDILPAVVEIARKGLIPLNGDQWVKKRKNFVSLSADLKSKLEFSVGDVFEDQIGMDYDMISCRNFLGYFVPEKVEFVVEKLLTSLRPGGVLVLDSFIMGKHPSIFENLELMVEGLPFFRKTQKTFDGPSVLTISSPEKNEKVVCR